MKKPHTTSAQRANSAACSLWTAQRHIVTPVSYTHLDVYKRQAYKFKPGTKPQLRFDILEEVQKRLPGFPIVLHGASSVIPEFVEMINAYGGNMPDAIGVPEDMLRQAAAMAVCKINIDSDLRLAMTGTIRKYLAENPSHFDPRQYLKPAREAIKQMVAHKIVDVLGCNGKA